MYLGKPSLSKVDFYCLCVTLTPRRKEERWQSGPNFQSQTGLRRRRSSQQVTSAAWEVGIPKLRLLGRQIHRCEIPQAQSRYWDWERSKCGRTWLLLKLNLEGSEFWEEEYIFNTWRNQKARQWGITVEARLPIGYPICKVNQPSVLLTLQFLSRYALQALSDEIKKKKKKGGYTSNQIVSSWGKHCQRHNGPRNWLRDLD